MHADLLASHSSTLALKIPWTEEPGRLQSMGSLRVGHDWATSLSLFIFMHWRRKWQLTAVFLPGESQGLEPCGLPSVGSHRVGHDWSDLAAAAADVLILHSLPHVPFREKDTCVGKYATHKSDQARCPCATCELCSVLSGSLWPHGL